VAAELYLQAAEAPVRVAIHCGAQNTADTIDLASHAAEHGADAVVAIGPPYYAFDEQELFRHFLAAAGACAPTPFYLYEFPARAGYSLSPSLVRRLLDAAPNLAGVKVSGKSFDQIKTFLELGQLNVFVGAESLIYSGMAQGAAGAVSALASAFPGLVASAVHDRSSAVSTERAGKLREQLEQFPIQAALKRSLVHQGVAMRTDVRAPLRDLSPAERDTLDGVLAGAVASGAAVSGAAAKR
jgi:4-hydroxy-tetrahydrodipicolinate synthase